jgi:hypothetical protein
MGETTISLVDWFEDGQIRMWKDELPVGSFSGNMLIQLTWDSSWSVPFCLPDVDIECRAPSSFRSGF